MTRFLAGACFGFVCAYFGGIALNIGQILIVIGFGLAILARGKFYDVYRSH